MKQYFLSGLAAIALATAAVAQTTNKPQLRDFTGTSGPTVSSVITDSRGNVIAPTNFWQQNIGDAPWKAPLTGVRRSQLVDYATTCTNGTPVTNFYRASGTGVVTNIRMVFQGGVASGFDKLDNCIAHIAYDGGGDVANVPWSYLIGLFWTNRVDLVAPKADTEFFSIADVQATILDFEVSYPIPFTNGCTVWTTSTLGVSLASHVAYQDALAGTPLSTMRLKMTNANSLMAAETLPVGKVNFFANNPTSMVGSNTVFDSTMIGKYVVGYGIGNLEVFEALVTAVANATNATVSWGTSVKVPLTANATNLSWIIPTEFKWLARPAGTAGFVAAVLGMGTNWLVQPNMRWFVDQEPTPTAEYWDTEQFFGANNGFSIQPYQGREVGQTTISLDGRVFAGYRQFWKRPIRYSNGIRMMVNHYGDDMSGSFTGPTHNPGNLFPSRMNFLTVYYE